MAFPTPTEKQAKILWLSLTFLAVAVLLSLVVAFAWLIGWMLSQLSSVLFPLAIAGIIAYLLDPLVDFLERRKISRTWAIMIVFLVGLILVGVAVSVVVPKLVIETQQLLTRAPDDAQTAVKWAQDWMQRSALGARAKEAWQSDLGSNIGIWL
ncbi:MAG: AI-2E family transporter, partial [Verrucomicrobia bacterium]|nr:AI-2E family transporter [Verrucomicrobiota bacterium]